MPDLASNWTETLSQQGWLVFPDFMEEGLISLLNEDAQKRERDGFFRPARVGRAEGERQASEIRRDQILWWDPHELSYAQTKAWAVFEELRQTLNRELYLGLYNFELHYSIYESGAFYGKHIDQHLSSDLRRVSVSCYLNPEWKSDWGGELLLYKEENVVQTVLPQGGTLACFLSDRIPHEVRPTHHKRMAMTGWFRARELR